MWDIAKLKDLFQNNAGVFTPVLFSLDFDNLDSEKTAELNFLCLYLNILFNKLCVTVDLSGDIGLYIVAMLLLELENNGLAGLNNAKISFPSNETSLSGDGLSVSYFMDNKVKRDTLYNKYFGWLDRNVFSSFVELLLEPSECYWRGLVGNTSYNKHLLEVEDDPR